MKVESVKLEEVVPNNKYLVKHGTMFFVSKCHEVNGKKFFVNSDRYFRVGLEAVNAVALIEDVS